MTTTKGNILDDVMVDMGYPTGDTDTRSAMASWFDDVLEVVLGGYWEWPYREEIRELSVVADSYTDSSLDVDIAQVRKMRLQGTRALLEPTTVEDLFDLGVDLTQTGVPTRWYYTEWDTSTGKQKFKLWPLPASNQTLDLFVDLGAPVPLDTSDTIPAPQAFIVAMKDGLRARCYYNDGNKEQGLIYEQKFMDRLDSLRAKETARPEKPTTLRMDGDLLALYETRRQPRIPDSIPYNET